MKNKSERGFSLVELLVVCVVIGVIAAIGVPALQKGIRAAELGNAYGTLRTVGTTQANFYSQNNRYGRLAEINNILSSSLGTTSGNEINRGKFVFRMSPSAPTDAELRVGFTITATLDVPSEGVTYVYVIDQSGLNPIFP